MQANDHKIRNYSDVLAAQFTTPSLFICPNSANCDSGVNYATDDHRMNCLSKNIC